MPSCSSHFPFQIGSNSSTFIRSAAFLKTKIRKPILHACFWLSENRVGWSSCLHLITQHLYPYQVWSTSTPWNKLRWMNGTEPSLGWQEWKPTFPASHQLNEVSMSIQLRLFSRIITLSWLQTNPSLGWFSGWTLCSLFSWSVGLWGRAHKMEAIVWDCQSCCKCDPLQSKALVTVCYAVTQSPSPYQELWT